MALCVFSCSWSAAGKWHYCRLLWRGLLPQCQLSSMLIGHLDVSNTLPPLSLVINSPLFPILTNSFKGWGKRIKQMSFSCWVPCQFITHAAALVKLRAKELVIPCNSQPRHNQYCIIHMHCLSLKVIYPPKNSLSLFSFFFFLKKREKPYGKRKRSVKTPSLLNCSSVAAQIFKLQFSASCVRIHPAL